MLLLNIKKKKKKNKTDHTAYTISTAGHEGFLNVLPIYIDHILNPTITDAGYTTEVHHINGKGENAGVVYCEMQARENTEEDRTRLEMNRHLWQQTPYQFETGGLMADLRTLNVQKSIYTLSLFLFMTMKTSSSF